jgi:tetratricopeptide (TPR) repeat protein
MANSDTVLSGPEMLEKAMQGFHAYELGMYEDARLLFQELAERDPLEGYYRTALGAIALAEDDLDSALAHFNEALRLNPEDTAALVNRGEVYLRLGSILEGAHDFARVVELDPENKDPLTSRARMLAAAALQSVEAAQSDSDKVR